MTPSPQSSPITGEEIGRALFEIRLSHYPYPEIFLRPIGLEEYRDDIRMTIYFPGQNDALLTSEVKAVNFYT